MINLFLLVIALIVIVTVYTFISGTWLKVEGQNITNSTNEMIFGDRFNCGYINTTTTLENLRDCYRD